MKDVPAVGIALVLAAGPAATAQWSDDPAQNLVVADGPSEQTQPKLAPTADGGLYVGWFDNAAGGYDVRLQRLDAAGVEQWTHNGVLLADRSFSSTQDWDLDVDGEGHALLAFRDDRFGGVQITATRVSPAGVQVWGPTGVQLTHTADFVAAPKIAATTDDAVVVAWTQDDGTILQRLDLAGVPQWGAGVTLTDPGGSSFSASDLDASDAGAVIISLVRGFFGATLHAQKLSAAGDPLWGVSPPAVFDGGSLQVANFPSQVPDGAGGAVFGWYGVDPLQCYTQHVLADGTEVFPHDGVAASTDLSRLRVSPSVSYDAAAEEIFLFWTELNTLQSEFGIYGQKFDAGGTRRWSESGAVLVPLDSTERTQVRGLAFGGGALVFFVETLSFGDQRVLGARVAGDGGFVWDPPVPFMSSASSSKSRLAAAATTGGFTVLAWVDGRNDAGDVYAQNVNGDGTLGPAAIPGDLDGDGVVGILDFLALLAAWGPCPEPCPPGCPADLDGDCVVGILDFLLLLANWG